MKGEHDVSAAGIPCPAAEVLSRVGGKLDQAIVQQAWEELQAVSIKPFYLHNKHMNFAFEALDTRDITKEVVDAWLQV